MEPQTVDIVPARLFPAARERTSARPDAWVRSSLAAITALAAVPYFWHLTINGYANTYHSAAALAASESRARRLGQTAALVALLLAWCVLVIRPRPIARVAEAPYVAWRPSSTG